MSTSSNDISSTPHLTLYTKPLTPYTSLTMDLTLVCQDCHNEFIWTHDDQQFYLSKGLEKPLYCLICRAKHRAMDRDPGKNAKKS